MSVKPYLLLLLLSLTYLQSEGQYRWDFGANIGASNYLGDIGGEEQTRRDFLFDMKINRTQFTVGGFGRYKISPQFAVNVGLNYGKIKANDYNSQNPARVARNLSFENNIIELSGRMEVSLFYDNDLGGKGYYNPDFRIYGFLGAGVIRHNPRVTYYGSQTEFNGEKVDLKPLMTEGVDYSRWQITLPAGLGVYFTHKKVHRFGFEIGYRTTFTDYLDDVSGRYVAPSEMSADNNALAADIANRTSLESLAQAASYADKYDKDTPNAGSFAVGEKRGDPTNNDGYLFSQVSYSYVIKGRSKFSKRRYTWIKAKKRKRRKSRAKF